MTTARSKRVLLLLVLLGPPLLVGCQIADNPIALHNRAFEQYSNGNYVSATGLYKWVLQNDPEHSASMVGLAMCYKALAQQQMYKDHYPAAWRDLDEALYWLDQALTVDPANHNAAKLKVQCLEMRGQTQASVQTARWAARYVGPDSKTLLLLAGTYMDAGQYDKAQTTYKRAIALAPNDPQCHLQAARFYKFTGKYALASKHLQHAVALGAADPTIGRQIEQLDELLAQSMDKSMDNATPAPDTQRQPKPDPQTAEQTEQ